MNKLVVLLAIFAVSVSCSNKETEKSLNKTNMSLTQVKNSTNQLNQQIRSKNGEETRNQKFEILSSNKEGFGSKMAAAAIYFKSFEFQLSAGTKGFEGSAWQQVLLQEAATEFTTRINDLYGKINLDKMSPTNDKKKHSSEQAFYALASTMHLNLFHKNDLLDAQADSKSLSFYEIIQTALRSDYNLFPMASHEEILVAGMNKEIMIALIKARVDMFSALALKNLTDKRNMTWGQKFKSALFKMSGGKWGSIELPEVYEKANEPTKKQTIKYLQAATSARHFLVGIGEEKELEKTIKSAFSKLKLGDIEPESTEEGEEPAEGDDSWQEQGETKEDADGRKVEIKTLIQGLLEE